MSRIYFFQVGENGPIKIGLTAGLVSRRRENLQIGCVDPIRIMGSYTGDRATELELHQKFSHLRVRGEWFRASADLLDFIARAAEPPVVRRRHDHPIARWRKQNRVTANELANKIGVSRETISRYETRASFPGASVLPKIKEITGIPARELRPDLARLLDGGSQ